MPEHLRALVVILALGCATLWWAQQALCPGLMSTADFVRRRNLWIGLTLAAFLSHNYWLFVAISSGLVLWSTHPTRESNPVAAFLFVLFAVPMFNTKIPGMGVIEHLFELDHARVLVLLILLPTAFRLQRDPLLPGIGKFSADWFLLALLALQTIRVFSEMTLTQSFRNIFYLYVDVYIVYYVCSRSIRDFSAFRECALSLCVGILVIAPIAVFEFGRGWLLYSSLDEALGLSWNSGRYLGRGNSLRATGPAGHSLVLGYALAIGLGLWMGVRGQLNSRHWWAGALLLAAGALATLSKGPWVGAVVIVLIAVAAAPRAGTRVLKLSLGLLCVFTLVAVSPYADKVVAYLPFVGNLDEGSVTYRALLFDVSMMVFWMNPILGSPSFLSNPLMEQMRQGEGIIDMVNSYLVIALLYGAVGVSLFVGFFAACLAGLFSAMRRVAGQSEVSSLAGIALFASIVGMMVMIATVSSIGAIPVIYWTLGGLAVAYRAVSKGSAAKSVGNPERSSSAPHASRRPGVVAHLRAEADR